MKVRQSHAGSWCWRLVYTLSRPHSARSVSVNRARYEIGVAAAWRHLRGFKILFEKRPFSLNRKPLFQRFHDLGGARRDSRCVSMAHWRFWYGVGCACGMRVWNRRVGRGNSGTQPAIKVRVGFVWSVRLQHTIIMHSASLCLVALSYSHSPSSNPRAAR